MKRVLVIRACKANESSSVLKQVDDILGEESDNESEGRGKDKPGNEEDEEQQQQRQQQPGPAEVKCRESGPQALGLDQRPPEPSSQNSILGCVPRWERVCLLTAESPHLGWPGSEKADQHLSESLRARCFFLQLLLIWWCWP